MLTMLATTAGVAFTGVAPAAAATSTTIVGNGDLYPNGPWALANNSGTYSFANGPAPAPGGVGSLAMGIASGQHEALYNYSYGSCAVSGLACSDSLSSWTLLANIDALSFSAYRASGTTYPTINVEADLPGLGSGYTSLVFVPDAGSISASPAWQTWDGLNPSDGTWYSTTTQATPPFDCAFQAAGCDASWSEIQTAYPTARVRYGLGPNVGSGGTFSGNIDNFNVGVSGNTTVYDFEPDCTTVCYVDPAGNDLNTGQLGDPVKTIQAGVNKVSAGGVVNVAAGTYRENVTVSTGAEIKGAGVSTIVQPAVSDPNCGGSGGGSLCGGASNVFLVQSSGVTIDNLLVDGDNPTLTSAYTIGGANVDARNGIITNHSTGTYNNLSVHDVTVKNVFLRGVYASSGGTFTFNNITVDNVQGLSNGSVAIFNFGGSGTMTGNHVSNAADGIAANHSSGTTMTGNVVTTSGSGLHSDNGGDGGGTADVLSGNTVSACTTGGYGVWTFVSFIAPTVSGNTVSGCDVGLATFASCDLGGVNSCPGAVVPTTVFSTNNVSTISGGLGLLVSSSSYGFGEGPAKVLAHHNTISGPGDSVYVEEIGGETATVIAHRNSVLKLNNTGATTVNATCNWWGQTGGPIAGQVTGPATTSPFLRVSYLNATCPATVPGTPAVPSAVPYYDHGAKLVWPAPANNGAPILGYRIIPYAVGVAQPAIIVSGTATTRYITGLSDGASYRFTVAARNAVGYGPPSAKSLAMIAGAPGQPGTPTAVKVASGSLKNTFAAPMNNGAPITSYAVTCASSNGGVAKTATGTASPITVTTLTAGKSYVCRVRATNSRGTGPLSNASAPVNA
jgi:hypothetical protein